MRIFDPAGADPGPRRPRLLPGRAADLQRLHQPPARHHPGHRPHRLGQDDHALLGAQGDRHARDQRHHHRRPDRDGATRSSTRPRCRPRSGITFAAALRHILRQDPDVIMVGEIRDAETAQYAIQAALTGHLVFSTLHTNDAAVVDHPPGRPRRRALPDQLDAGRRHGAAPGAPDLPALRRRALPRPTRRRRRSASPVPRRQAGQGQGRRGLLRMPRHRLPRPHRHLRDPADRRRRSST